MAPPKKKILRTLSDAHLRAIGRVASQWTTLEITLLWTLSKVAKLSFKNAIILAGAQNASAFCDMLQKISGDTYPPGNSSKASRATNLDKIAIRVGVLMNKRNGIVHGAWHPRQEIRGLLSTTSAPPRGTDRIEGFGIPKRGKAIFSEMAYTSREIIAIADQIAEVEQDVFGWFGQWQEIQRLVHELERFGGPRHPGNKPTALDNPYLSKPLIGLA